LISWRFAIHQEQILLQRIADRDSAAMTELYHRYSGVLFSSILTIVKTQPLAEEVLQEVFVVIWEKAHLFDGEKGSPFSWLIALTRNRAIERMRAVSANRDSITIDEDELLDRLPQNEALPIVTSLLKEKREIIREALLGLPEDQRDVLQYGYFMGKSEKEIAKELKIENEAVKPLARLALKTIADLMNGGPVGA
tara:strand:- start:22453 stop:23037 length:585 start_codon:yes stop_codon:yes gene_type:complete